MYKLNVCRIQLTGAIMSKNNNRTIKRRKIFKFFFTSLSTIYILICLYFYIYQEQLLFHPESVPETHPAILQKYEVNWVNDSVKLHGWYIHDHTKKPLLVYFGGNAEIISDTIQKYYALYKDKYDILAFEYRGFGASQGTPSEKKLIHDAIDLVEHWSKTYSYQPEDMVLIGRSLGTGIAVQVAFAIQPRGMILITPYDSINAVAEYTYPYIPISYLNYNTFLSDKYAPHLCIKGLYIIAENDKVTPAANGFRLAQLMSNTPEIITLPHAEHSSVYYFSETWSSITQFLSDTFPPIALSNDV